LIFSSHKIIDCFSNKSSTPFDLQANLVYSFKCHSCSATYIGETYRHLRTRVGEHGQMSRKSAVLEHNLKCKERSKCNLINDFNILKKNFKNYSERVACEALMIRDLKPDLNGQTDCLKIIKVF